MSRVTTFALTLLLSTAAACAADGPLDDEPALGEEAPDEDGKFDITGGGPSADLYEELKASYGVRPRRYGGFFNDSNTAEHLFIQLVPEVTAFLNRRLESAGYTTRLDETEVAINFITEGGYYVLDGDQLTHIDGYSALGVDTLVGNIDALRGWLPDRVLDAVEGGTAAQYTNERGETVTTLSDLTLETGLYANAGMYAWSRAVLERDLRGTSNEIGTLSGRERFFWTTAYFNAGIGTARRLRQDNGVAFANEPWTRGDDPYEFSSFAHYNASWRSASYDFLLGTVYAGGSPTAANAARPIEVAPETLASGHPYDIDDPVSTYASFEMPGALEIRLHFSRIDLPPGALLELRTGGGVLLDYFNLGLTDHQTPFIPTDRVELSIYDPNASAGTYGFEVDRIEYRAP